MISMFICIGFILLNVVGQTTTMNFAITHSWNSTLITDHQPVQLKLSSTDDKEHLFIEIDAPFFNDPAPPSTSAPGPYPGLWDYEVVELFFLNSSTNHYIELEFFSYGQYLVLLLFDRRKVLKELLPLPDYTVKHLSSNRWIGQVRIPRCHFPSHIDRFNAYAIHGQGDNRTYEALYPAPAGSEKPDFHRLELFQPLDFDSLLYVGEKDGDCWNTNGSSRKNESLGILTMIFFLTKFILF